MVPNLCYNLLSMSKLIQDMHCVVLFLPDVVIFQARSNGTILGIDREIRGLYIWTKATDYSSITTDGPDIFASSITTNIVRTT